MGRKERPLARGWVECYDEGSEKYYFANLETKETRWEFPEEALEEAFAWRAQEDASTGKRYFYNKLTRETRWENPNGVGGGWAQLYDESQQKMYYVHEGRGLTQWKRPLRSELLGEGGEGEPAPAASTAPPQAAPEEEEAEQAAPLPDPPAGAAASGAAGAAEDERFARLRALRENRGAVKEVEEVVPREPAKPATPRRERLRSVLAVLEGDRSEAPDRPIGEFAEHYFNLNRKGLLHGRTTVEKVLAWKAALIKTGIMKLPSDQNATAVQTFRNITGYMGDRPTKKESEGHVEKLLKSACGAPQQLRDEVYCQLLKQTNKNPNPESLARGWRLFSVCAGAFPASDVLFPYLESYLHAAHAAGEERAGYTLARLRRCQALGPRVEPPLSCEVEAVLDMHPTPLRVYFPNGSYCTLPVDSGTTVEQAQRMVGLLLGVADAKPYGLFECDESTEETSLLVAETRVMDVISYWQRVFNEGSQAGKRKEETFHLLYKPRLFFAVEDEDHAGIDIMYQQAVSDVVKSTYPCSDEDALALAALQHQEEDGECESAEASAGAVRSKLDRLLPKRMLRGKGKSKEEQEQRAEELAADIGARHAKLAGYGRVDAKLAYLDLVREWEWYGSTFFFARPADTSAMPEEVFLAINPRGVLIVDPVSKEVVRRIPYAELPSWAHDTSTFALHVGNMAKQKKLYFETDEGKDMNRMVHAYVGYILERASGEKK